MKIIFDLDGTLICSKKRLYELFCDIVQSRTMSFSLYWEMKFSGYRNEDILKRNLRYTQLEIDKFVDRWMRDIENDYYLSMDTLIDGVPKFLEGLRLYNDLYICTARQSASQVEKQLKELSILDFFQDVFVTRQKITKTDLLLNSGVGFGKDDWFVGDTGHDVLTGRCVGVRTCAVLSGFMSRSALEKYEPELIIDDVTLLSIES